MGEDIINTLESLSTDLNLLGYTNGGHILSMVLISIKALHYQQDILSNTKFIHRCQTLQTSVNEMKRKHRRTIWRMFGLDLDDETEINVLIENIEKSVQGLILTASKKYSSPSVPTIYGAMTLISTKDELQNLPEGYYIDCDSFELKENSSTNIFDKDVTMMMSDNEGKEFWKNYIGKSVSEIKFEDFLDAWMDAGGDDISDEEIILLRDILNTSLDNDSYDYAVVTSISFSLFLSMFGPFSLCRYRMISCTTSPWFYGALSATYTLQAFKESNNMREGSFLVRYSQSDPGRLVVTYIDSDRKIINDKIYNLGPLGYSFTNSVYSSRYETVAALIKSQSNILKYPLEVDIDQLSLSPTCPIDEPIHNHNRRRSSIFTILNSETTIDKNKGRKISIDKGLNAPSNIIKIENEVKPWNKTSRSRSQRISLKDIVSASTRNVDIPTICTVLSPVNERKDEPYSPKAA